MKNAKTKIYIGIGLALSIGAIVYIVRRKKANGIKIAQINAILDGKVADPNTGGGQKIILKTDYDKLPMGQYPVKFGQANKRVYEMQKMLNVKHGTSIDLDGKYGESTWNAMCDKVWSNWTVIGECYELTKTAPSKTNPTGLVKRYLQQKDYELLKNKK